MRWNIADAAGFLPRGFGELAQNLSDVVSIFRRDFILVP